MLPFVSKELENYKLAISQNVKHATQFYIVNKTSDTLFNCKMSMSIRQIEIYCGYYGKLSKEFSKQYFSDIVVRCFDVVLLFDTPV